MPPLVQSAANYKGAHGGVSGMGYEECWVRGMKSLCCLIRIWVPLLAPRGMPGPPGLLHQPNHHPGDLTLTIHPPWQLALAVAFVNNTGGGFEVGTDFVRMGVGGHGTRGTLRIRGTRQGGTRGTLRLRLSLSGLGYGTGPYSSHPVQGQGIPCSMRHIPQCHLAAPQSPALPCPAGRVPSPPLPLLCALGR